MTTPHISANFGDFSDTVILPGDPLRAKFIAETYLTDCQEITAIRNMLGFTGYFEDKRISVMGSGMGIPSCSIYAKELIKFYGVKNLIRVGTCGALQSELEIRDILFAIGASTDSNVNRIRFSGFDLSATANYELLDTATVVAQEKNIKFRVGNVFTTDLFYPPNLECFNLAKKLGILAIEMETAGLYGLALETGARAFCILTVSDHVFKKGGETTPIDREQHLTDIIEIALMTAARSCGS